MKSIFITLIGLMFCTISMVAKPINDPQPEKIYAITMVAEDLAYYQQQAQLWKKELIKHPKSDDAWYNYYLAARYTNMLTKEGDKPYDMKELVQDLEKKSPESFAYYYLSYCESPWGNRNWENLLKAYELDPSNAIIYPSMVNYNVLHQKADGMKKVCQQWYDSETYSPGMAQWNYNVLMSVEKNALLLTTGDNDTYPAWLLQQVKNVRPDVQVVNIYLLRGIEHYRKRILTENKIAPFDKSIEDFENLDVFTTTLLQHIFDETKRPVYMNITGLHSFGKPFKENLYMTGLAVKYSKDNIDNTAILKNNIENKFLLDYLSVDVYNDISQGVVNKANLNYIAPFTHLYKHYKTSGEVHKAEQLKKTTLMIAEDGGRLAELKAFFEQQNQPFKRINSIIPMKLLEKGQVKIRGKLWASSGELSNAAYEMFLMDLVENREFSLLEKCQIYPADWRALLPEKFQKLSDKDVFLHGHPEADETPVQNISYEAAQAYCQWITNVYNNSTDRKKKHQKVVFRLPTIEEWEYAARAGKEVKVYPWDYRQTGPKPVNLKGCYLANFNVAEEAPCEDCPSPTSATSQDGGFFTVPVDAYFPNDLGLYNTIGNVAEMVQDKGVAKGGSWEDHPDNCTISSKKSYENTSPAVGFRVFMEVLK